MTLERMSPCIIHPKRYPPTNALPEQRIKNTDPIGGGATPSPLHSRYPFYTSVPPPAKLQGPTLRVHDAPKRLAPFHPSHFSPPPPCPYSATQKRLAVALAFLKKKIHHCLLTFVPRRWLLRVGYSHSLGLLCQRKWR